MDGPAPPPTPPSPSPVPEALARMQRMLLKAGYSYVQGDPESWPLCFVTLQKGGSALVVGPWHPEAGEAIGDLWRQVRRRAVRGAGLLVVGDLPPDDARVRGFLAGVPPAAAYVDAAGCGFHRRRSWNPLGEAPAAMRPGNLRRLTDPSAAGRAADVDCRERLRRDLADARETSRFVAASRAAGGVGKPHLTHALILLLLAGFAGTAAATGGLGFSRAELLRCGALHGPLVRQGQVWRLITCAVLHVNLIHLFFNGYALYYFGSLVETFQGRGRLGLLLAFSIVTGSLASLWWHPEVVSAGASGGLFGLIGAMAAVVVRQRRHFPPRLLAALRKWLLTILLYNVALVLLPFIDHAAHVGGLVGGLALGLIVSRAPARRERARPWVWVLAAALFAAAAAAGAWVIWRMPP